MRNREEGVPEDPLGFIRRCVSAGKVLWTYHVQMRLRGRSIGRKEILESVPTYQMIEAYPEDKYLPSYLVYCEYGGEKFHVLFATDLKAENVRIVTAYRPSSEEWAADLKTRRRDE